MSDPRSRVQAVRSCGKVAAILEDGSEVLARIGSDGRAALPHGWRWHGRGRAVSTEYPGHCVEACEGSVSLRCGRPKPGEAYSSFSGSAGLVVAVIIDAIEGGMWVLQPIIAMNSDLGIGEFYEEVPNE